jgi:peptide/nickel transport system ATP-binding protein
MSINGVTPQPLVRVQDLSVTLFTQVTTVRPVCDVSYQIGAGETLAMVGESGSGKTVANLAPLRLLPTGLTADCTGSVKIDGQELIGLDDHGLRALRGRTVGVIFQDPLSALNPARRIGSQIIEMIERHTSVAGAGARRRAVELLDLVGIAQPEARLGQYPHELSGGMRQRVMIAIAIAGNPKLLIADEPTTALDVTVQAQIVELLKDIQRQLNMAIVLITHDIGVVAGMADQVVIMYAGSVVESGSADDLLTHPIHPYTQGLLASIPSPADAVGSPFRGLSGRPPNLEDFYAGCAFAPRCPHSIASCEAARPPIRSAIGRQRGHRVACPVVEALAAGAGQR